MSSPIYGQPEILRVYARIHASITAWWVQKFCFHLNRRSVNSASHHPESAPVAAFTTGRSQTARCGVSRALSTSRLSRDTVRSRALLLFRDQTHFDGARMYLGSHPGCIVSDVHLRYRAEEKNLVRVIKDIFMLLPLFVNDKFRPDEPGNALSPDRRYGRYSRSSPNQRCLVPPLCFVCKT